MALILAVVREVEGHGSWARIELADIEAGIVAATWVLRENMRLYAALQNDGAAGRHPHLLRVDWILERHPSGEFSLRDYYSAKHLKKAEGQAQLQELVEAGLADWYWGQMPGQGGHQPQMCRLRMDAVRGMASGMACSARPPDGPEKGASGECRALQGTGGAEPDSISGADIGHPEPAPPLSPAALAAAEAAIQETLGADQDPDQGDEGPDENADDTAGQGAVASEADGPQARPLPPQEDGSTTSIGGRG